jgi:hypothetical protein
LHDHEPTQHEAVATFPDAGHPTKEERDEQGQIGDGDHSRQYRDRSVDDKESDLPGLPLEHMAPYALIFKALLVEDVVFEYLWYTGIVP